MGSAIARYVAGGAIGVFALFALYNGLACFANVSTLLGVAAYGEAVVEQNDANAGKVIAWYAPDGQRHVLPAPVPGIFFPDYAVSERVDILYHAENPANWKINSFAGLWLWGLTMDVLGITLLAVAALILPRRSLLPARANQTHQKFSIKSVQ